MAVARNTLALVVSCVADYPASARFFLILLCVGYIIRLNEMEISENMYRILYRKIPFPFDRKLSFLFHYKIHFWFNHWNKKSEFSHYGKETILMLSETVRQITKRIKDFLQRTAWLLSSFCIDFTMLLLKSNWLYLQFCPLWFNLRWFYVEFVDLFDYDLCYLYWIQSAKCC